MITQKLARSIFDYSDGELYWKVNPPYHIKIGSKAGTLGDIYYQIQINGELYKTHRLIFLYHHGYLPKYLDHIDNNPQNNKIENLREVTQSQNLMNKKSDKNSSSICKGVSWDKNTNKWRARIHVDYKDKHLGLFESEIGAAIAYNNAATELFGEYAKLNEIDSENGR